MEFDHPPLASVFSSRCSSFFLQFCYCRVGSEMDFDKDTFQYFVGVSFNRSVSSLRGQKVSQTLTKAEESLEMLVALMGK